MKEKKSKFRMIIEVLCLVLLVGMVLWLLVAWNSMPDEVAGHYNAAGHVDRYGSKGELWILPITSWILYVFITFLQGKPQCWNTGVEITEENKERIYRILKNMIVLVKLEMILTFFFIQYSTMTQKSLSSFFLPVELGVLFGTIIVFIVQLFKNK